MSKPSNVDTLTKSIVLSVSHVGLVPISSITVCTILCCVWCRTYFYCFRVLHWSGEPRWKLITKAITKAITNEEKEDKLNRPYTKRLFKRFHCRRQISSVGMLELWRAPVISIVWCKVVKKLSSSRLKSSSHLDVLIKSNMFNMIGSFYSGLIQIGKFNDVNTVNN